jgi:hypothetical protein
MCGHLRAFPLSSAEKVIEQHKKAATEVAAPNPRDLNRPNLCRTAPGAT